MKNYINQINSLVDEINSLPTISEENQRKLDKKFRLEFNYNSNHLEGNTLTYQETDLLLFFDKTTDSPHEMREYEEMKAHDVTFKLILEWAMDEEFRLSEIHIKQLNEIILVRPFYKEAVTQTGQPTRRLIKIGQYKSHPNSVQLQNGEMFHYASPLETPMKMGDLTAWYHEETEKKELHPVELAALFHYKFVLIHPFDDGNGRISRLLMNYILLKNNLPPIIIKTAEKKTYLNALNQADTGNIEAFVEFVASELVWSLDIKKKAIKGESLDEPGDLDKEISVLNKILSNKDDIGKTRTMKLVCEVIENSFLPIFFSIEEKIASFTQHFHKYQRSFLYSTDHNTSTYLGIGTEKTPNSRYYEWIKGRNNRAELVNSVMVKFDFLGFKKLLDEQNANIELKFNFNEYFISVHMSTFDDNPMKIPYGQEITEAIKNEIVENTVKKFVEDLKQLANKI